MAKDLNSVRAAVELLAYAKSGISKLKEIETEQRAVIEEALGSEEIGQLDGETVVTWTTRKQRRLNQSALKENHPELVEEFTELVESRTFKMVDPS